MAITRISEEVIEVRVEGARESEAEFGRMAEALDRIEKNTRASGKESDEAGKKMRRFSSVLRDVHSAAHTLEIGIRAVGKAMSGLTVPVKMATSFEKGFAQMSTLLDGTREEMSAYRDEIKGLASDLPQSAGEITTAGYRLLSSKTAKAEVSERMRAASELAVAANTDLQTAAKALQLGVNTYGAGVQEASDALFTLVKMGDLDGGLGDAITALARAGDVTQLGVQLDEVAGALQLMTINGKDAGTSATQLLSVVKVLSRENSDASKTLKKMGVETGVAAIKAKGLAGVLADVQRVTGGQSEAITALSNDFEATRGMLALLGDNFESLTDHIDAQANSAGSTAIAYEKMANTTAFAAQRFESLKNDVLIDLGDKVLPHVNDLLERLSVALREHGDDMAEALGQAMDALASVGDFLLRHGGKIATVLGSIFAVKTVTAFSGAVGAALKEVQRFEVEATGRFGRVGGKLASALKSAPVIGAIAGAGLVLADALVEAFTEEAREKMAKAQAELAARAAEFARARGFKTPEEMMAFQGQIDSGVRTGHGKGIKTAADRAERRTPEEWVAFFSSQVKDEGMKGRDAAKEAVKRAQKEVERDAAARRASAAELERQSREIVGRYQGRTHTMRDTERGRKDDKRARALSESATGLRAAADALLEAFGDASIASERATGRPSRRVRVPTGPSDQSKLDAAQARRLEDLAIAAISDPLEKALATINAKASRATSAAKEKGLDPSSILKTRDAEASAAFGAAAGRSMDEQTRAEEVAQRARMDLVERLRVDETERALAALDAKHAAELERYRSQGLAVNGLVALQADERASILSDAAQVSADAEAEQFRRTASNVETMAASLGELAEVVGASSSVVGAFEALGLSASVAFHGAQVFSEGAKAATAYAAGLVPVGLAHTAAATSHAAAGAKSAAALGQLAGLGAGGATSSGVGGGRLTQPATPSRANSARMTERRQSPGVQIGEISLGRMVYVDGADGRKRLAEDIARDVVRAVNTNAGRPGGARFGSHSMR